MTDKFDPLPWLRAEAALFDEIGEPGAFEHGCKITAAADEIKQLRAECGELRAMLETSREAIASAPEDAFGDVAETHDCPGYWIRDALVHDITKALQPSALSRQKAVHRGETDFCTHGIDIQKPCEKCRQRSVRAGKPENNTDRYFPPPKDTALNPETTLSDVLKEALKEEDDEAETDSASPRDDRGIV